MNQEARQIAIETLRGTIDAIYQFPKKRLADLSDSERAILYRLAARNIQLLPSHPSPDTIEAFLFLWKTR